MDHRRVHLLHLHQRPRAAGVLARRAQRFEKQRAVTRDILLAVRRGEAEVQGPSAVTSRNPAPSGTESVHQPRQGREAGRAQNLERVSSCNRRLVALRFRARGMGIGIRARGHSPILMEQRGWNSASPVCRNTITAAMLLYYITDRKSLAGTDAQQRSRLLVRIVEAARAGVDYIQLREKDLAARDLERLARDAARTVRENSATAKLLINGRADVALASGADGVHLPAGELAASEVRALWMRASERAPVIAVSAHTIEEVRAAADQGESFAVLAPIFEKAHTGVQGIGIDALRAACASTPPAES